MGVSKRGEVEDNWEHIKIKGAAAVKQGILICSKDKVAGPKKDADQ